MEGLPYSIFQMTLIVSYLQLLKTGRSICYSFASVLSIAFEHDARWSQWLELSQATWLIPSEAFYSGFLRHCVKILFQELLFIDIEWCPEHAIKTWDLKLLSMRGALFFYIVTEPLGAWSYCLGSLRGSCVGAILRVATSYLCYDPELTCKPPFYTGLNCSH